MSIRIMSRILEHRDITDPRETLVLLALGDWANDEGQAWPTMAKLASHARCSERGLQVILARMEKCGWISIERTAGGRPTEGRQRRGNLFAFNMAWLRGGSIDAAEGRAVCPADDAEASSRTESKTPKRVRGFRDATAAKPVSEVPAEPLPEPQEAFPMPAADERADFAAEGLQIAPDEETPHSLRGLWEAAMMKVRLAIGETNFEAWLCDATGTIEGTAVTVAVPGEFHRSWIARRYTAAMEGAFAEVLGVPAVTLVLRASEETPNGVRGLEPETPKPVRGSEAGKPRTENPANPARRSSVKAFNHHLEPSVSAEGETRAAGGSTRSRAERFSSLQAIRAEWRREAEAPLGPPSVEALAPNHRDAAWLRRVGPLLDTIGPDALRESVRKAAASSRSTTLWDVLGSLLGRAQGGERAGA